MQMSVKKKFLCIAAIIIISAIIIVLCVGFFTGGEPSEFDGTLVNNLEFPYLL